MRSFIVLFIMGLFFVCISKVTVELSKDIEGTAMLSGTNHVRHWAYEDFPLVIHPAAGTRGAVLSHLRASVAFWNKQVGTEVFVISDEPIPSPRSAGTVLLAERPLSGWVEGRNFAGLTQYRTSNDIYGVMGRLHSANVWLDDSLVPSRVFVTLVHELGHVLGLAHDDTIGSCMFPIVEFVLPIVESRDLVHIRRMASSWPELILE